MLNRVYNLNHIRPQTHALAVFKKKVKCSFGVYFLAYSFKTCTMTSSVATYKLFLVSVKFSRYFKHSLRNKGKLVPF